MIIDAWVNPNFPEVAAVWSSQTHPTRVASHLFHAHDRIGAGETIEETASAMDVAGVDGGVLSSMKEYSPFPDVLQFHELVAEAAASRPDRFVTAGGLDPRDGLVACNRMARRLVEDLGFRALKIMPASVGLPADDRCFYPLYATCCELGVPITVNVGMPGAQMAAAPAQPVHLDEVCRTFPELTIVMTHVGFPWHLEVIGMLVRYEQTYLMTSAWSPRHYPPEIVHHIATRGKGRVMFATDYPLLGFDRCVREAQALELPADAAEAFFHTTAEKVFQWTPSRAS